MRRRKTNKKFDIDKVNFRFVPILVIAVVLLLSIGYSALEANIFMELTANFKPVTDVRITNISPKSATEGAYSTSEKFVKDSVSIGVNLPESDSEVLYNVEITNFEEPIVGIYGITQENENIDVEITDYTLEEPLCDENDKCNLGSVVNVTLKVKYKDGAYEEEGEHTFNTSVDFDFRGYYTITYSNMNSDNLLTTVMDGASASINLQGKNVADVYITSGASTLVESTDYTLTNNSLVINSVDGNINIAGIVSSINEPELYNGSLTPVVYSNSNWVVADTTTSWYDYSNGQWANAVILGYTTDVNEQEVRITKSVGDTVDVDGSSANCEILGMFVWIPRFSYTIKYDSTLEGNYGVELDNINASLVSASSPGAVDIRFISTTSKEKRSASYTNNAINYNTHPAFTKMQDGNSVELAGFWVAKFINSNDGDKDLVVPNVIMNKEVYSDTLTNAASFNTYLDNQVSKGDSHLLKNSEWDAVSLLAQSIYGKYGNSSYIEGNKEVYYNNSILYYTGRSAGAPSGSVSASDTYNIIEDGNNITTHNYGFYTYDGKLLDYNANTQEGTTDLSKVSSTTGNIYGVYDMNTVCSEVVSTFNVNSLNSKYYDTFATSSCLSGICYGNTSFTYEWYSDHKIDYITGSIILRNNANVNDNVENGIYAYQEGDTITEYCYRSSIFIY